MAYDEHVRIRCRLCNEAFKYGHIVVVQIGFRIVSGLKGCITKAHCWEVVIAKPHVLIGNAPPWPDPYALPT